MLKRLELAQASTLWTLTAQGQQRRQGLCRERKERCWGQNNNKGGAKSSGKEGKDKGKSSEKGGGKNPKSNRQCCKCGKFGHRGYECRSNVNRVQETGDDTASVQTKASSSVPSSASTAAPKSQVRRIHAVDLADLEEEIDVTHFGGRHIAVDDDDLEVEAELPSTSAQGFMIGVDDD